MLHVTNGDSARYGIEATGIGWRVLPWRDALHDGPVPGGLDEVRLRQVRASFLEECGWGGADALAADLAERDAALEAALGREPVVLWFEHDLYDQLQLLQVLDRAGDGDGVELIQAGEFLGPMTPDELERLWPARRGVTAEQAALARDAWAAFRSADPGAVPDLLDRRDAEPLPWLAPALRRLVEERPGPDGLARSERTALHALAGRPATAAELFQVTQAAEEAAFLGDTWFFRRVADLATGDRPLLIPADGAPIGPPPPLAGGDGFGGRALEITPDGRAVLEGRENRAALTGLDRWTGGVHFTAGPRRR